VRLIQIANIHGLGHIWTHQPPLTCTIDKLENVQRQFTKRITSISHLTYHERLIILDLDSLELRRLRFDLIQYYNILNNLTFANRAFSNAALSSGMVYRISTPMTFHLSLPFVVTSGESYVRKIFPSLTALHQSATAIHQLILIHIYVVSPTVIIIIIIIIISMNCTVKLLNNKSPINCLPCLTCESSTTIVDSRRWQLDWWHTRTTDWRCAPCWPSCRRKHGPRWNQWRLPATSCRSAGCPKRWNGEHRVRTGFLNGLKTTIDCGISVDAIIRCIVGTKKTGLYRSRIYPLRVRFTHKSLHIEKKPRFSSEGSRRAK